MISPEFSLKRLASRRAVFNRLLYEDAAFGTKPAPADRERLAAILFQEIDPPDEFWKPVWDTVRHLTGGLAGCRLDSAAVEDLSITIAGREKLLREGLALSEWRSDSPSSWNMLYTESVERVPTHRRKMFSCNMRVFSGEASGQVFRMTLPSGFLQQMIRAVGGRKYDRYLNEDAGGLWFTAWMSYSGGRLRLDDIAAPPSVETRNRKLLKARKAQCVWEKKQCFNCFRGRDLCSLARHARTYEKGVCRNRKPYPHKHYIVPGGYCLICSGEGKFNRRRDETQEKDGK